MSTQKVDEGLAYKQKLLKLLDAGKINLSDLEITVSSDEENSDDIELNGSPDSRTNEIIQESNHVQTSAEDEENDFQMKYHELQKTLNDIPSVIAQLNTELEMLSRSTITVETLPSNDKVLDAFFWKFSITIEWEDESFSLPIQRVEDIEKLNTALTDETIYHHVFNHLSLIYGKNKLRNMSIAAARLFKILIDVSLFNRLSWTGKTIKGKERNIAFKEQNNIQKVLLECLNVMDNTYTQKELKDDIIYKVLKFAK